MSNKNSPPLFDLSAYMRQNCEQAPTWNAIQNQTHNGRVGLGFMSNELGTLTHLNRNSRQRLFVPEQGPVGRQ